MSAYRSRRASWLFPAAAAALIICGFSYVLHLRAGKGNLQATPASANQAAYPSAPSTTSALDLVGIVKSTAGEPLQNASVFIYTARPHSGPGFL